MALTLVATLGAADANSYLTVAKADEILAADMHDDDWRMAVLADKVRALITATRYADQRFDWFGNKATLEQSLRWPRHGISDAEGYYIPPTRLPSELEQAVAYLAQEIIRNAVKDSGADSTLSRIKVGSIEIAYKDHTTSEVAGGLPEHILAPLYTYGRYRGATGDGPRGVVRA